MLLFEFEALPATILCPGCCWVGIEFGSELQRYLGLCMSFKLDLKRNSTLLFGRVMLELPTVGFPSVQVMMWVCYFSYF